MEPTNAMDNMPLMEPDGLSDIIDVLNAIDNPWPAQTAQTHQTILPTSSVFSVDILNTIDNPLPAQTAQTAQTHQTILPTSSATLSTSPRTAMSSAFVANPTAELHILENAPTTSKNVPKSSLNIVEQPAGKALRFRYECEGRSAGSIPGVNSTPENKTYPTIEIVGYTGEAVIVVSCVTKDQPYRPHPHNLVGKDGCKNGICTLQLNGAPMRAVFSNLGIQCVKKKEVRSALDLRESKNVDPFSTGFAHKDQPSSIDLNAVRLCFQAFLKTGNTFTKRLKPVVSDPIYDKKAMSDLVICRLCSCAAKVGGGDEIIMLCEKVAKDDIKIKFYESNSDGEVIWETYADFQQTDIHKQTAIAFKTPRYHKTDIIDKAQVFLQLVRPSDNAMSEPLPFEYFPDPDQIKRKRLKTGGNPLNILKRELLKQEQQNSPQFQNDFRDLSDTNNTFWNTFMPDIKMEPTMSPQNFGPHRSPYQQMTPSPQPFSPTSNRNTTPSPSLQQNFNAASPHNMGDMFNYNALKEQNSPPLGYNNALSTQTTPQFNGNNTFGGSNNVQYNDVMPAHLKGNQSQQNNNNTYSNTNSNNVINQFVNHLNLAPNMSGGSITPIWNTNSNNGNPQNNMHMYQNFNIPVDQSAVRQQQHQQFPGEMDALVNASTSEETPTLSSLLRLMDNDPMMNINSDDLPLSNLSITT